MTGSFSGPVDFDPGAGEFILDSKVHAEIMVCKFDSFGEFIWVRTLDGVDGVYGDSGEGIYVDANSDLYVTGYFDSKELDLDPGEPEDLHWSKGSNDSFLVKLSDSGGYIWGVTWGGSGDDRAEGIAGAKGWVLVYGGYEQVVDFDPGAGFEEEEGRGRFLTKFGDDGAFIWVASWLDHVLFSDMTISKNGDIFLTGLFALADADFDPGPSVAYSHLMGYKDAFLLKLSPEGQFKWAYNWGGELAEGHRIALDLAGNIYTTGIFGGLTDFGLGEGNDIRPSVGQDSFLIKFTGGQ